jgi:CRISPR-associated protein Cas2
MFDLPVKEFDERRVATKFRKFLLDEGFSMSQLSVYAKFVGNREKTTSQINRIKDKLPAHGSVSILFFTDKQYENIINYTNKKPQKNRNPEQLLLQFD